MVHKGRKKKPIFPKKSEEEIKIETENDAENFKQNSKIRLFKASQNMPILIHHHLKNQQNTCNTENVLIQNNSITFSTEHSNHSIQKRTIKKP